MDDFKAVQVHVTGRVQGVGFRGWTRREAMALGLAGWVRNEPDGSVAALLVGSETMIATMLERLHHGPSYAAVTGVTSTTASPTERPADFRIAR
jgi:acylphosphatase